ncbi:Os08g0487400 [Oryza sativa Japonica Group]|uniref:Os08g0487400 protein n=1 Tax=Oryza sativa subsp. japonica TaxID=39947 RepID=A0A0N7KQ20_ORYSJ|nr:hypothetical protein EE612_045027 [Oryza sativa]BAT05994.1 Os08g0487400 [Oryza sativa Japonica Group]
MTAPPMWLPFGGAERRETAAAELEPHARQLPDRRWPTCAVANKESYAFTCALRGRW